MRRHPRRRPGRRTSALLAVSALTGGLLLTAPQPASAANLITNPGFETAGTGDMPYCWEKSGWGDNDFTFETVADAHSGTKAMKVELTRRTDGDRKALITESAECAPVVTEGKQYDLSLWYKTTTPDASLTLFRHDATAGWQYWTDLKTLDLAADWTRASVRTPRSRPAPTASAGASPSTAPARRRPTTTRWSRSPTRFRTRSARAPPRSAPTAAGTCCPPGTRSAPCTPSSCTTARCC